MFLELAFLAISCAIALGFVIICDFAMRSKKERKLAVWCRFISTLSPQKDDDTSSWSIISLSSKKEKPKIDNVMFYIVPTLKNGNNIIAVEIERTKVKSFVEDDSVWAILSALKIVSKIIEGPPISYYLKSNDRLTDENSIVIAVEKEFDPRLRNRHEPREPIREILRKRFC